MEKINTKVLSGFMELLPSEQIEFDKIKSIIEDTYKLFGFSTLDTPSIERCEVLLAKEDDKDEGENQKNIFLVKNRNSAVGIENTALRFDLTVPLARYVAEHFNDLSFPFRRCQLSKVYRGESAQKGRYREFYQCDIDVIGKDSLSIYYDAEIPTIIYQLFKKLNFGDFTIRVNNRKILNGLFSFLGIGNNSVDVLRIVDKKEKMTESDLVLALQEVGLNSDAVKTLLTFVNIKGAREEIFIKLMDFGVNNELFLTGIDELKTVTDTMIKMGVDESCFEVDLSIARGLDYYTGTVYETKLNKYPQLGSVCSGGRFDNLASYYTKERLPGVGISIGLTRLFYKLNELGLVKGVKKSIADIIVVPLDKSNFESAMIVGGLLRKAEYRVDVLLEESMKIKSKFQYVNRKKPFVTIVIGDDEERNSTVVLQTENQDGQIVKETILRKDILKEMKRLVIAQ